MKAVINSMRSSVYDVVQVGFKITGVKVTELDELPDIQSQLYQLFRELPNMKVQALQFEMLPECSSIGFLSGNFPSDSEGCCVEDICFDKKTFASM